MCHPNRVVDAIFAPTTRNPIQSRVTLTMSETARQTLVPDGRTQEVLDKLDWWDERNQGHHTQKRTSFRPSCRTLILVQSVDASGKAEVTFKAWTRNLSQGGLSFILPRELPLQAIVITWCDDKAEPASPLRGRVVRFRRVHDGYWEYGVEFLSRERLPEALAVAESQGAP